ncbi:hypothetical protein AB4K20DRAFT_1319545 [Rhizopus microsporus]
MFAMYLFLFLSLFSFLLSFNRMPEKKELPPNRYCAPQVQSSISHKPLSIYQSTPKPKSAIVHEKEEYIKIIHVIILFISVLYLPGSKR